MPPLDDKAEPLHADFVASTRRFKYGVFLHPAIADPAAVAYLYTQELVQSLADPISPELGAIDVRWHVVIRRVDDSVVFDVTHTPDRRELIIDDQTGPVRRGLLEALDWWNGETLLIAPQGAGLEWDKLAFPNAWSNPWGEDLQIQNITQYPNRLGKRVLSDWNPGLLYVPFEVFYEPPTREQEITAMRRWTEQQEKLLHDALALLPVPREGPWFLSPAQRYLSALVPLPSRLSPVGSLESAQQAARDYRGACFLIHQTTFETQSWWYER